VGYPDVERERDIILSRVPGISSALAEQIAQVVRSLRSLNLKKAPSVAETLDWARTLVVLGRKEIGDADAAATLHILLKYQTDIERASKELLGRTKPVA
jgi:MoxR-like ATPase